MSAVRLDISIQRLRKCYVGKDENGVHTLDKSKINELSFKFALFRVNLAIEKGELTEESFISELTKEEQDD